jgi:hypothetical protein
VIYHLVEYEGKPGKFIPRVQLFFSEFVADPMPVKETLGLEMEDTPVVLFERLTESPLNLFVSEEFKDRLMLVNAVVNECMGIYGIKVGFRSARL